MPLSSVNSCVVHDPLVPFDKIRFGMVINTSIGQNGQMRSNGMLNLTRCRFFEDGTCEDAIPSVGDPPVRSDYLVQDWFALAAEMDGETPKYPALIQAMGALMAAVAEFNTINQLV